MTVCIIYGFTEGKWHSKQLVSALIKAGYEITQEAADADIVIAHSGGCFLVPKENRASLILIIGLNYWSGKSILKGTIEKTKAEVKNAWWYRKISFNGYYLLTKPIQWIVMLQALKNQSVPQKGHKVLLLRNEHDSYMHPLETRRLAKDKGWGFMELAGQHDDIWHNPKPYVEIIKSRCPIKSA